MPDPGTLCGVGPRPPVLRELTDRDLHTVARIDALQIGIDRLVDWRRTFSRFEADAAPSGRIALGAEGPDGLEGFLSGEARASEFGSEACGWVFVVGVAAAHRRRRTARLLLEAACRRFAGLGLDSVRTMVRRDDVPCLSNFRAQAFIGGRFVQLERTPDSIS